MARESPPADAGVTISLSGDEALVFFELLARSGDRPRLELTDPAERRVLWNLEAALQRHLTTPLDPRYAELLEAARAGLRDAAA